MTDRDLMTQVLDALAGLLRATPWADHPQEAYSAERAYKALWVRLARPDQEPESECNPQDLCAGCRCKYAAQPEQPPQRTWVGLTDEEYDEIWRMDLNNKELMDKTIAKLKEKNNG
jgi:hypothetical protein